MITKRDNVIINAMKHNLQLVTDMQKKLYNPDFVKVTWLKRLKLKRLKDEDVISRTIAWFCSTQNVENKYEVVYLNINWLLDCYDKIAHKWGFDGDTKAQLFDILIEGALDLRTTAFILNIKQFPDFKYKIFVTNRTLYSDKYIIINILLHELRHTIQSIAFDKELEVIEKHNLPQYLRAYGWSKEYDAYLYAFENTLKCLKDIV